VRRSPDIHALRRRGYRSTSDPGDRFGKQFKTGRRSRERNWRSSTARMKLLRRRESARLVDRAEQECRAITSWRSCAAFMGGEYPMDNATAAQQLAPSRRHAGALYGWWHSWRSPRRMECCSTRNMVTRRSRPADSSSAGQRTKALCRYSVQPGAHFTLWYFHGNAEDLGDLAPRLQALRQLGLCRVCDRIPRLWLERRDCRPRRASGPAPKPGSVFARRAKNRPATARALRPLARGGPAVELARVSPWRGLVAGERVYECLSGDGRTGRLLPGDKFCNLRKDGRGCTVRCLVITDGKTRWFFPFAHGEALLAAAPGRKSHLWVDSAGHNDVLHEAGEDYWRAMRASCGSCRRGSLAPTALSSPMAGQPGRARCSQKAVRTRENWRRAR